MKQYLVTAKPWRTIFLARNELSGIEKTMMKIPASPDGPKYWGLGLKVPCSY